MSKKIGFPVLSLTITGVLYILALLLGALPILVTGLGLGATGLLVNALLFFIAAFLAGLALISYALHPELDETQRLFYLIFLFLLLLMFFNAGVSFSLTF
nr:hypothetical protein [Candidatus Njordarchaeota archaeon]